MTERLTDLKSIWLVSHAKDYSRTSLSGHSEKRTHSLERIKLQSQIEPPILVVTLAISEKQPPLNSEERTLS